MTSAMRTIQKECEAALEKRGEDSMFKDGTGKIPKPRKFILATLT